MISTDYFWRNILLLGAGTFLIRSFIIVLSARFKISERMREIFSFIPAAILPAILAPMVFFHQGHVEWLHGKERMVVLLLAMAVSFWKRNMLVTIGFGLGLLYLIS